MQIPENLNLVGRRLQGNDFPVADPGQLHYTIWAHLQLERNPSLSPIETFVATTPFSGSPPTFLTCWPRFGFEAPNSAARFPSTH